MIEELPDRPMFSSCPNWDKNTPISKHYVITHRSELLDDGVYVYYQRCSGCEESWKEVLSAEEVVKLEEEI